MKYISCTRWKLHKNLIPSYSYRQSLITRSSLLPTMVKLKRGMEMAGGGYYEICKDRTYFITSASCNRFHHLSPINLTSLLCLKQLSRKSYTGLSALKPQEKNKIIPQHLNAKGTESTELAQGTMCPEGYGL